MNRARFSFAATFVASLLCTGLAAAQTQAPPMKSVLAGKKLTPPARGEVLVEYTAPVRKNVKDAATNTSNVVATFQVKNVGLAPIARLSITQTWFDKANNIVGSGKESINGLLQPGEVRTISISIPYKPSFNGDGFNFTHANGTVRVKPVAKFPPAAAAKK
jgi:hypothetical protein